MSLWGWRQKMDADRAIMECKQIQAYKDQQRKYEESKMKFKTKEGTVYTVLDECINGITFEALAEKAKNNKSDSLCITMFGRTVFELADIICKHEKENIKMTRKEARSKLIADGYSHIQANSFLDGLDTLGLIKFEEEPKEPDWVTNYKSMNIKDMVIEIVNITHYRTQTKNYNERIAFLKSQLQLKLDQY